MSNNFFSSISSKQFIINLGFAVFAVIILFYILIKSLGVYTHHGQAFSTPDFSGMTYNQALKAADNKDLKIKIIDSVYSAPGRRGTIIDQNPPRDFKVKQNRTIFVTIKAINPEIIKMPNFINTTLIQTKADIETYGLKIDRLVYKPSKYDNMVLEQLYKGQKIKAGANIEKGSKITLVLGRSSKMDNTVVPNLSGLYKEQAELKAAEYMLNIGTVLYDETVISYRDSTECKVVKQRPLPGTPFNPGEEIDIWFSMMSDTLNNNLNVNE